MMTGSPGPSLAEVRAKGQPPEVLARLNDEHWFGRLYMRRLSPYATLVFARLGWSPNAVTVCFMISGAAAGVLAAVPGLPAAVGVALLMQLYLLFDCSDGELARYTGRFSATGVYLDRMGHYLAEALLLAGLGVRAQGHFSLAGGYVSAGPGGGDLRHADQGGDRRRGGGPGLVRAGRPHDDAALAPRSQGLALARRLAAALRVHRIIQAVELSAPHPGGGDRGRRGRRPHRHPGADRGGAGGGRADDGGAPGGHRGVPAAAVTTEEPA